MSCNFPKYIYFFKSKMAAKMAAKIANIGNLGLIG